MTAINKTKSDLKVALYAGDVLMFESDDPILWREVLSQMNRNPLLSVKDDKETLKSKNSPPFESATANPRTGSELEKFAQQLGTSIPHVEASCSPTLATPYLHLDAHHWAAFRRKYPSKGIGSVSNIAITATLLCLWLKHIKGAAAPTISDCQKVLKSVGFQEANAKRSLSNCTWLQYRDGAISISSLEIERAIEVARSYCERDASKSKAA